MGRGVSGGGGQSSLGYLFGGGETTRALPQSAQNRGKAPSNEPDPKLAAASPPPEKQISAGVNSKNFLTMSGPTNNGRGRGNGRGGGRMVDIPMPPYSSDQPSMHEHISSPSHQDEEEEILQEEDNSFEVPTTSGESTSSTLVTLNKVGELRPERDCQIRIREAIETKFREDAVCWTKISPANRDMMFDYWKNFFQCDPNIPEKQIRHAWEKKSAKTFKEKMFYIRSKAKKKPLWWPDSNYGKAKKTWNTSDYKSLCLRNKKNRLSKQGVVVHHGGSRSRSRYEEKLENELGREPSQAEIWCAINATQNADGSLVFCSVQAEQMHKNYLRDLAQHPDVQGQGDDYQPPMELQRKVWAKTQGISKRGAVIGLASEAKLVRSPSRLRTWTSSSPDLRLRQEVELLRSENTTLRQEMEMLRATQEEATRSTQEQIKLMMQMIARTS